MKSTEIRKAQVEMQEDWIENANKIPPEATRLGIEFNRNSCLAEIAAQLAELNESRKPQWVNFPYKDGRRRFVDISQLLSVSEDGASATIQSTGGKFEFLNDDFESVCAKIGITLGDL